MTSREIQLRVTTHQHDRLRRLAGLTGMSAAGVVATLMEAAVVYDSAERLQQRIDEVARSLRAKPRLSTRLRSLVRAVVEGYADGSAKVAINKLVADAAIDRCRKSNTSMDRICAAALLKWSPRPR